MSEDAEKAEKETTDARLLQMQEDLDQANEEVEQLKNDRKRQIDMVAQIVRQRDMYKVLLSTESVSFFMIYFGVFIYRIETFLIISIK